MGRWRSSVSSVRAVPTILPWLRSLSGNGDMPLRHAMESQRPPTSQSTSGFRMTRSRTRSLPPNPRLQRTRLCSPLSRKPFGDTREM